MKHILVMALIVLGSFSVTQTARAELLIEPVVGWSFNQQMKFDRGEDYTSGNGVSYGGRLGYQKLGLQVGLDYLKSTIEMGSNDFKENVDTTEWAAFVGYKFPILFRVYAGWIFSAEADSDLNRTTMKLEEGTGAKLGVGFTILPFFDLNLEYRRGTYDKAEFNNVSSNGNVDFQALMASVSLPLTF